MQARVWIGLFKRDKTGSQHGTHSLILKPPAHICQKLGLLSICLEYKDSIDSTVGSASVTEQSPNSCKGEACAAPTQTKINGHERPCLPSQGICMSWLILDVTLIGLRITLNSDSQSAGCDPPLRMTNPFIGSHIRYPACPIFTLCFVTVTTWQL